MKKKIAISTVLAVLFTAYAIVARWKTFGLGIYTLDTTVGKILIHTWRPALVLAVIFWIIAAAFISAQRKKALAEPKETRAEKKARIRAEKEMAKAEAKAAKKAKKNGGKKSEPIASAVTENKPMAPEKQPEPMKEAEPVNQGATVVLGRRPVAAPEESAKAPEESAKTQEEPAKAQNAVGGAPEVPVHTEIETQEAAEIQEVPAAPKITPVRSGFCSNCGAPMKETQRFCTKCGCEAGKEDTL